MKKLDDNYFSAPLHYTTDRTTNMVVSGLLNIPATCRVYLRDGSALTLSYTATLRQKLLIKLHTSPSHSILIPGLPVLVLTLLCKMPGRATTRVPILKSLVTTQQKKTGFDPHISCCQGGCLTIRPLKL